MLRIRTHRIHIHRIRILKTNKHLCVRFSPAEGFLIWNQNARTLCGHFIYYISSPGGRADGHACMDRWPDIRKANRYELRSDVRECEYR